MIDKPAHAVSSSFDALLERLEELTAWAEAEAAGALKRRNIDAARDALRDAESYRRFHRSLKWSRKEWEQIQAEHQTARRRRSDAAKRAS